MYVDIVHYREMIGPFNSLKIRSSKIRSSKIRSSKIRSSKIRSSKIRSSKIRSSKIKSSKIKGSRTCKITEIFYQFLASLNWILLRCLILFTFPIRLGTFLVLNFIPVVWTPLPLNDFSVFIKVCFILLYQ